MRLPPGAIIMHSGITVTEMGPKGVRFKPLLDNLPPERMGPAVAFEQWWSPTILTDMQGHEHSRRSMVLALANQDGGAHVDPVLKRAYAALAKENSLGREGTDESGRMRPLDNIVLASVRQAAHELDRSVSVVFPNVEIAAATKAGSVDNRET